MIKLLFLLMLPMLTFASISEQAYEFNAAKQLAVEHESSEISGCYFACEFDPHFGVNFESVMAECFDTTAVPQVKSFEVIVVIGKNGVIGSSWLEPNTNIGQCLSSALEGSQFPNPPFSPFYASIVMHISGSLTGN
ncbi:hypothetical protein [Amphritea sp. HPY]|uniref:hypothetical protein n=1 Tax=Amphritea sp. HPY TaxID=3421652 RepID=UPI003D7DEAF0